MESVDALTTVANDLGAALGLGRAFLDRHVLGGKQLRRRLVEIVAGAGDDPDASAVEAYGWAIELVHAGALVHDDVMDGSLLRRGRATLWREVGTRRAVLAGAALMLLGEAALARAPSDLRRETGLLLRDVARGQTDELAHLGSTRVSPEAYLRRAYAKTGALYELAARLGAAAGRLGARETEAVADFAARIGVAFQLADDVRDLVGGVALGRPAGTDLCVGIYTLPVLETLAGRFPRGAELRMLLARVEPGGGVEACVDVLERNGALDHTARRARAFVSEAVERLAVLASASARERLASYAADLLGPLPTTRQVVWPGGAALTSPSLSRRTMCLLPPTDLVLAGHPTIPSRLARLRRRLRMPGPLADAVTLAASMVWLADEVDAGRDEPATGQDAVRRLQAVATVDLLIADLCAACAGLPARQVDPVLGRTVRALRRRIGGRRRDDPPSVAASPSREPAIPIEGRP